MKTILITGASSGIGAALALHYAAGGHRLILGGRDGSRLQQTGIACRALGAEVHTQCTDVAARDLMHQWIVGIDKRFPLDLVIANAGISGGPGVMSPELYRNDAARIFETNLMGVVNTLDPILPRLVQRKRGQVAVISSLAGFSAWPGAPAYSASKAAVRLYGLALRARLASSGVGLTVVCPGFVVSRMTEANDFPMPFILPTDRAAAIIATRLERNPPVIAFPWHMALAVRALGLLPDAWVARLLARLPEKKPLQSSKE